MVGGGGGSTAKNPKNEGNTLKITYDLRKKHDKFQEKLVIGFFRKKEQKTYHHSLPPIFGIC
jgi:hypothetical protein